MKNKNLYFNLLFAGICLSLFTYVTLRAYNLSFTHDEGLSYTIVKGDPRCTSSANHHILNTNLMKITSFLFGDSELSLRLPNVLAFIIYMVCCFQLLKNTRNFFLAFLGISVLLINPFMLDYFSLARGYGLSLGFMMASVFYFFKGNQIQASIKSFINCFLVSICFASLALFSNLSTLNFFIALILTFLFQFILLSKNNPGFAIKYKLIFSGVTLLALIPLAFAINRLLWLKSIDQLYFGSDSMDGSLSAFILNSSYKSGYTPLMLYIKYLILAIFLLGLLMIIFKKDIRSHFSKITLLFTLIISGLFIENYLLEVNFPFERTSLYLFPLFGLFLFYFVEYVISFFKYEKQVAVSGLFCLIFALPLSYNLLSNMNINYSYTWKFDKHTKDIITRINDLSRDHKWPNDTLTISNNWVFEPALNYYIASRKLKIHPANRDPINLNADFIYDFTENGDKQNFKKILDYPDIGTSLYQKN